jgi:hypothetical protein
MVGIPELLAELVDAPDHDDPPVQEHLKTVNMILGKLCCLVRPSLVKCHKEFDEMSHNEICNVFFPFLVS